MKLHVIGVALAAAAIGLAPLTASAQQPTTWWSWALPRLDGGSQIRTASGLRTVPRERSENDDAWSRARRGEDPRTTRDTRDGRYDPRGSELPRTGQEREARSGRKGPKFCRNGQGHPVYGMAWCREKGFGGYYAPVWRRASLGDVILRRPTSGYGTFGREGLLAILGRQMLNRFTGNGEGDLAGRLFRPAGTQATVLQVQSGGVPVAELTDLDSDGRADMVLIRQH